MKSGSRIALLVLCALLLAQPAEAQFFKDLFRKKDKKERKAPPRKAPVAADNKPKPVRKKDGIDYPDTKMRSRYRIDVLVPLYLDEVVVNGKPLRADKVPDKAQAGLNFYQGIRLAADTLSSLGYQVDVYVHDVTTAGNAPGELIRRRLLDSTDLIIGAIPTSQVATVAAFAKERKVNFVSALSPADAGVADNPYFTLLQPTLESHCAWIRKAVQRKYPRRKILVYDHSAVAIDAKAYEFIVGTDNETFRPVSASAPPPRATLQNLLDSNQVNVIIMPVLDADYAARLIRQLDEYFPAYRFDIYGMPSWKGMDLLRKTDGNSGRVVYFTAPFYFDGSTAAASTVMGNFQRSFSGRPSELVYRAYETLCWYSHLLSRYGTIFNEKLKDNSNAAFTRYEIEPKWSQDRKLLYLENQHLYLFRYQAGNWQVDQ